MGSLSQNVHTIFVGFISIIAETSCTPKGYWETTQTVRKPHNIIDLALGLPPTGGSA